MKIHKQSGVPIEQKSEKAWVSWTLAEYRNLLFYIVVISN